MESEEQRSTQMAALHLAKKSGNSGLSQSMWCSPVDSSCEGKIVCDHPYTHKKSLRGKLQGTLDDWCFHPSKRCLLVIYMYLLSQHAAACCVRAISPPCSFPSVCLCTPASLAPVRLSCLATLLCSCFLLVTL